MKTTDLALSKLDRIAMSNVIREFLETLPIKSMREKRRHEYIYSGVGNTFVNNEEAEVSITISRTTDGLKRLTVTSGDDWTFFHPFNHIDDAKSAASKLSATFKSQ